MTIDGFVRFKNCVSSVYLDRRGVDIPRTHLDIINVTRETFRKRSILKKFVEKLCGYSIHREHVYIYIYQMQITCFPLFLYDRNFSSNSHSRQEEFPLCNKHRFVFQLTRSVVEIAIEMEENARKVEKGKI